MRSLRSEKPLSVRYVEPCRLHALAALCAALVLAGCAGAPRDASEPDGSAARSAARASRGSADDAADVPADALAAYSAAIEAMQRGDDAAAMGELARLIGAYPALPRPRVND